MRKFNDLILSRFKALIRGKMIKISFSSFIKVLAILLCVTEGISSCSPRVIYVPKEKTIIKDSIIRKDSIVYVPQVEVKNVVPKMDTLVMKTEVAEAKAWNDSIFLKGAIKTKPVKKEYVEVIKTVEIRDTVVIVKEVPVEKPIRYVPTMIKVLAYIGVLGVLLCVLWLCFKLKLF